MARIFEKSYACTWARYKAREPSSNLEKNGEPEGRFFAGNLLFLASRLRSNLEEKPTKNRKNWERKQVSKNEFSTPTRPLRDFEKSAIFSHTPGGFGLTAPGTRTTFVRPYKSSVIC